MAELADAADSKSAGLRPLGVRFPLPAPPAKAAPDAGSSQSYLPGRERIQTPPKSSCDRAVTGDGRNQTHWNAVGLESLESVEGDERYGPTGCCSFAYSALACLRMGTSGSASFRAHGNFGTPYTHRLGSRES